MEDIELKEPATIDISDDVVEDAAGSEVQEQAQEAKPQSKKKGKKSRKIKNAAKQEDKAQEAAPAEAAGEDVEAADAVSEWRMEDEFGSSGYDNIAEQYDKLLFERMGAKNLTQDAPEDADEAEEAVEVLEAAEEAEEVEGDEPEPEPELLAGKYKSADQLAEAYKNSERKMHEALERASRLERDFEGLKGDHAKALQYIMAAEQARQQAQQTPPQPQATQADPEAETEAWEQQFWANPKQHIEQVREQAKHDAVEEIKREIAQARQVHEVKARQAAEMQARLKAAETHFQSNYPHLEPFSAQVALGIGGLVGTKEGHDAFMRNPAALVDAVAQLYGPNPAQAASNGAPAAAPVIKESRTPLPGRTAVKSRSASPSNNATIQRPPTPEEVVAARQKEYDFLWS